MIQIQAMSHFKTSHEFEAPECIAAVSKTKQVVLQLRCCPQNQGRGSLFLKRAVLIQNEICTVLKYESLNLNCFETFLLLKILSSTECQSNQYNSSFHELIIIITYH